MIGKIVKGVARAMIAQPWDYVGEGAPNDWEFRVAPDEESIAVYNPNHGRWVIFKQAVVLREIRDTGQADRELAQWDQFLPVLDPDA